MQRFALPRRSCLLLVLLLLASIASLRAQQTVEGNVTAFRGPGDFDVEGVRIAATEATTYSIAPGSRPPAALDAKGVLGLGAHVMVHGKRDGSTRVYHAKSIALRDETQKHIEGFSVVQSITANGTERLIEVDGYRVRIDASTKTELREGLSSLDDVAPGVWMRFDGYRDASGVVLAERARLVPGLSGTRKRPAPPQETAPVTGSYLDSDGGILPPHTKVRLSDAAGLCGWHRIARDPALQARILRLADRLIPAWQRALPADARARIPFRFYAVDEPNMRDDTICPDGLVLIPAQAAARLANDDQLAALVADGIAGQLLAQRANLKDQTLLAILGTSADIAAIVVSPWTSLAIYGADSVVGKLALKLFQEEGARVSLSLMANAGFDPWQAPEARRLLGPKRLPRDTADLPYPDSGLYLLSVLHAQYASGPRILNAAR